LPHPGTRTVSQSMSGDRPLENLAHQHQHHQQFPQQTDPRVHFTSPQSHEDPLRFGDGGDGGDGGGGGGVRSRPTLKRSQSPVNSDALILLPEVARAGKPVGSRRPFQRRRRSRACDACRARKTKVGLGIGWNSIGGLGRDECLRRRGVV